MRAMAEIVAYFSGFEISESKQNGGDSSWYNRTMPENQPNNDHAEMLRLIRESNSIAKENNVLLRRLYRHSIWGITLKVIWFAIIIGLPFAIYYYLLGPYLEVFGANYDTIKEGMPWLRELERFSPLFAN